MATAKQIAASRRNLAKARKRRRGSIDPDKAHGSGTGLTSAYRYLKPLRKNYSNPFKPSDLVGKRVKRKR